MQKKTILIIKCVVMVMLFICLSLGNTYFMPISCAVGIISCTIQLWIVSSTKKKMWLRFIIPIIPVIIFTMGIIDAYYPHESSGGLFPMSFEPWFGLQLGFYLLYMTALFPIAITVLLLNKYIDKIFLMVGYLFCIGTASFLYACYPYVNYLYFIGCVILLAIVVLIFPQKSQFCGKQDVT